MLFIEPMMKGLVQWMFNLLVLIMDWVSGQLLGILRMDLAYFEQTAPVIHTISQVMFAAGWALLIGNLVFQSLRSMFSGAGWDGESPVILAVRTLVFAFLLCFSRPICNIALGLTKTVMDLLQIPAQIKLVLPDGALFDPLGAAKWLVVIIVGVILIIQYLKLMLEIGERYVIAALLTYLSPLAFSMGGSKSTEEIFRGWARMYASMLLMLLMNIVILKLILSAMTNMANSDSILVWMVFIIALVKAGRKMDSIVARIGLNPAITGDSLGSRIPGMLTMMAMRTVTTFVRSGFGRHRPASGREPGNAGKGSGGKPNGPANGPSSGRPKGSEGPQRPPLRYNGTVRERNTSSLATGPSFTTSAFAAEQTDTGGTGAEARPGLQNPQAPDSTTLRNAERIRVSTLPGQSKAKYDMHGQEPDTLHPSTEIKQGEIRTKGLLPIGGTVLRGKARADAIRASYLQPAHGQLSHGAKSIDASMNRPRAGKASLQPPVTTGHLPESSIVRPAYMDASSAEPGHLPQQRQNSIASVNQSTTKTYTVDHQSECKRHIYPNEKRDPAALNRADARKQLRREKTFHTRVRPMRPPLYKRGDKS